MANSEITCALCGRLESHEMHDDPQGHDFIPEPDSTFDVPCNCEHCSA